MSSRSGTLVSGGIPNFTTGDETARQRTEGVMVRGDDWSEGRQGRVLECSRGERDERELVPIRRSSRRKG